jgi:hypothetical protein
VSVQTLTIGPSTGWLYAREIFSLYQQETILKAAGANSVEICLAGWNSDDRRTLSLKAGKSFDNQIFVHRSLHLPDVNNQGPAQHLALTKGAIAYCGVTVALTHPIKTDGNYPVKSYEMMISAGVPLALENMDSRKESGFNLAELERLVTSLGCGFVLDAQHAYEHDHSMRYASDLFELMKDHLVHLHVSGETKDNIHSLVHKATNAKEIIEFVGQVLIRKNVPLILEGKYTTSDELRQEIEFLKYELGFYY